MQAGNIINNYEILELINGKKNGYYFYLVKAKCLICGSLRTTTKREILNTKQRCGVGPCHRKFINLKSQRFGNLTVKEYVLHNNKWKWKCECDCGDFCFVRNQQLTKSGQTACKKCTNKQSSKKRILPNNLSAKNRLYRIYKKNAKDRNISFELTLDEVLNISSKKCFYCDSSPSLDSIGLTRNGIDRVNSNLGYTIENTVPCCFQCNQAKLDYNTEDFYSWIYNIYNNLHKKGTFNDYPVREYAQVSGNGETLNK